MRSDKKLSRNMYIMLTGATHIWGFLMSIAICTALKEYLDDINVLMSLCVYVPVASLCVYVSRKIKNEIICFLCFNIMSLPLACIAGAIAIASEYGFKDLMWIFAFVVRVCAVFTAILLFVTKTKKWTQYSTAAGIIICGVLVVMTFLMTLDSTWQFIILAFLCCFLVYNLINAMKKEYTVHSAFESGIEYCIAFILLFMKVFYGDSEADTSTEN